MCGLLVSFAALCLVKNEAYICVAFSFCKALVSFHGLKSERYTFVAYLSFATLCPLSG